MGNRLSRATRHNPSGRSRVGTRSSASQDHVELERERRGGGDVRTVGGDELPTISEEPPLRTPNGTDTGYEPFYPGLDRASDVMENTINGLVLQAASEGHSSVTDDLMPISDWMSETGAAPSAGSKTRGGKHTMTVLVALSTSDELTQTRINALHRALRAD